MRPADWLQAVPIYQQIRDRIVEAIGRGGPHGLLPCRLPSRLTTLLAEGRARGLSDAVLRSLADGVADALEHPVKEDR